MSREGISADLEAMKKAGIGGVIFLEVDIGVARGPVGLREICTYKWIVFGDGQVRA